VDEMHVAVAPVLLGTGEALLPGLDLPTLGYRCSEYAPTAKAAHYVIVRAE
jgi:dihydrofolate reductase